MASTHTPTPIPMSSSHQSTQPKSAHVEPTDDETPNETAKETPTINSDEVEALIFVTAIDKLVQACPSMSKPKLWEPNPINGSNSKKLHTFIFQCKLNFRDCKDLFHNEETKVNYALSYLKGITLDCFEPALLDLHDPIWLSNFGLFIMELENNFRTFDPEGEAEAELEALCMHENHQAMKYFIKFQQLAARVQ